MTITTGNKKTKDNKAFLGNGFFRTVSELELPIVCTALNIHNIKISLEEADRMKSILETFLTNR